MGKKKKGQNKYKSSSGFESLDKIKGNLPSYQPDNKRKHHQSDDKRKHHQPYKRHDNLKNYYPLPDDVNQILLKNNYKIDNISLLISRFVPHSSDWKIEKKEVWQGKDGIEEKANQLIKKDGAKDFLIRHQNLVKSLKTIHGEDQVVEIIAQTVSNLSIGFGNVTPMETGITLNRLYGLPCIPATSIKGTCRSYKLENMAYKINIPILNPDQINEIKTNKELKKNKINKTPYELLEDKILAFHKIKDIDTCTTDFWKNVNFNISKIEKKPKTPQTISLEKIQSDALDFIRIFGTQDSEGAICFYDSYPIVESLQKKIFKLDIINVHFQKYYDGKEPPADYLSPVPNYFLTISPEIKFRFILVARDKKYSYLLKQASNWLKKALTESGIGSKTAVGYGEMKIVTLIQ